MARPAHIEIDVSALKHNIQQVALHAPNQAIMAMVKADAYGCGVSIVVPALEPFVDAFGVACLEEAKKLRRYTKKPCVLCEGVFKPEELFEVVSLQCEIVLHHQAQLQWLLNTKLDTPVRVWVKFDTGMHRLGFMPDEAPHLIEALQACAWVQDDLVLMTHFASADEPDSTQSELQYERFRNLSVPEEGFKKSIANSAAIFAYPEWHVDVVRPGIMLYGVSPFALSDGVSKGLQPVMQFISEVIAIDEILPGEKVGYGGAWTAERLSRIAVVAAGYGDGYPRHIAPDTKAYIEGQFVPIVGRVSMDMLTVDITDFDNITIGSRVELWGKNLPVERIARAAGTIGYELLTQISPRVREKAVLIE